MFNLNNTHTLVFTGVIKALNPISIKPPEREIATMPVGGEETCLIPSTTIRGKLRHLATKQMLATDAANGKPWDLARTYKTLIGQTAESEEKKGDEKIDLNFIQKEREADAVVGVFGAGIEIPSSLLVSHAVPSLPVAPITLNQVRKDLGVDTVRLLNDDDEQAWAERSVTTTKRVRAEASLRTTRRAAAKTTGEEKDALDAEVKRLEGEIAALEEAMGTMENSSQALYGYLAMPAGTECNLRMDLKEPSEAMEMVLLGALFNFAHEPLLGGQIARGCGRVSASLTVERRRGVGVETLGTLVVSGAGAAPEFHAASDEARAWYDERIAAWLKRNEVDSEAA